VERWAPVHADEVLASFERDVFPALGEFPPHQNTALLILAALRLVEKRGAVEILSRAILRDSILFE